MNYFNLLPITDYSFDNDNYFLIRDFTVRSKINILLSSNSFLYETYSIKDGERPEDVSFFFYNTPYLHWVVLLTNEMIDPIDDWCLSNEQVIKISQAKYENIYATHHWEDANGFVVNAPDSPEIAEVLGLYPVSNLDYETNENEKKREIKVLRTELISKFLDEFKKVIVL